MQPCASAAKLRAAGPILYGAFDVKLYIDVALLLSRGLW
jgi:hypothetical protein